MGCPKGGNIMKLFLKFSIPPTLFGISIWLKTLLEKVIHVRVKSKFSMSFLFPHYVNIQVPKWIFTIGSGSCGCSQSSEEKEVPRSSGCCARSEENNERARYANHNRTNGYDKCPPREPDPCDRNKRSCSADDYSPPCSGKKECCPSAGYRPICKKKHRCQAPCEGNNQKCGGGGCCGSGCRGGCGKPGQTCLPLKSCNNPPCQIEPFSTRSPCLPPRSHVSQLPCCKAPQILGISRSMSGRNGHASSFR